jgi:hypothetical protein
VEVTATANAVVAQWRSSCFRHRYLRRGERQAFRQDRTAQAVHRLGLGDHGCLVRHGQGFGTYIAIDLALMTEVLPPSVTGGQESAGRDLAIFRRLPDHPYRGNPVRAAGNRGHQVEPLDALTRIPSVRPVGPLAAR